MIKVLKYILLLILTISVFAQTPGRRESQYGFEIYYRPPVHYDFFVELPDQNNRYRINFLLRIQNDLFRFTKTDNEYLAQYDVTVAIKKAENKKAVFSETWRKSVQVGKFDETNSKIIYQVDQKYFDIALVPGDYRLFLEVIDSGTAKGYHNSRSFTIKQNSIHTDIKLFNPGSTGSGEIILGAEPPIVEFNQDQKVSFAFQTPSRDSLIVTSKLLKVREENSPIIRQKMYRILASDDITTIEEIIAKKHLKEGSYLIKYRIKYNQQVTNLEKYFSVVWFDKPVYLNKHDLALRPMIYMLSPEEFEYADGLSYDELGEWLEEFWDKKDPTPESPLNEIKFEYFTRVNEANKKYSQRFSEGWETDRGKALILYGTPSRIESNRYVINKKPYEIWYYDTLKIKLTFVDRNKEENYKMVSVEDIEENENE